MARRTSFSRFYLPSLALLTGAVLGGLLSAYSEIQAILYLAAPFFAGNPLGKNPSKKNQKNFVL
jgi:hypothetical protein